MGFRFLVLRECRRILRRSPATAAILFLVPLGYLLLFGDVYRAGSLAGIPLVILDEDATAPSRSLIRVFEDSEKFRLVAQATGPEEVDHLLREGEAKVALVIPRDFAKRMKQGLSTPLLLEADSSNLIHANVALKSGREIVQNYSAVVGQRLGESVGRPPLESLNRGFPVRMRLRVLGNPTLSYKNFILSGIGVNGLQLALFITACVALSDERFHRPVWRRASAGTIVAAKLLPTWLLGVFSLGGYVLAAGLLFRLPYQGRWGDLFLLGGAFCFAVTALGLFFSALLPSKLLALQLPILYVMPGFLCCGYSWPLLAMTPGVCLLAGTFPLSYVAVSLRDLTLTGYAPELWGHVRSLLALGGSFFVAACLGVAWRKRLPPPGGSR